MRNSIPKAKDKAYTPMVKSKYILFFIIISIILSLIGCVKSVPADGEEPSTHTSEDGQDSEMESEVLPQLEREADPFDNDGEGQASLLDPFSDSFKLSGILTSNLSKDNIAIIETESTSFIVRQTDSIAGYWEVKSIEDNAVLLKHDDEELVLELGAN